MNLLNYFTELLDYTSRTPEANITATLRSLLMEINSDVNWSLEESIGKDRLDLVSPELNVIIECKKRSLVVPESQGRRETQKEQVGRYLKNLSRPLVDEQPWRGFLTDGVTWFGWEWDCVRQTMTPLHRKKVFSIQREFDSLIAYLNNFVFDRFSPNNLKEPKSGEFLLQVSFRSIFEECRTLMGKIEFEPYFKTKIGIWHMQLEGSGITPPQEHSIKYTEVFCRHSFIVIIAKLLISYLTAPNTTGKQLLDSVSDGFHSWIVESKKGEEIVYRMIQEIRKYHWRSAAKDILKDFYEALIDKEDRKEFGEYYTPDYLAQDVVEQVLDDEWCDAAIKRASNLLDGKNDDQNHLGVLDPSCGSGTFLFHSAKRLLSRINTNFRELKEKSAYIVSRLVHGIDVHPVAVEMSRATLLMALPPPPIMYK